MERGLCLAKEPLPCKIFEDLCHSTGLEFGAPTYAIWAIYSNILGKRGKSKVNMATTSDFADSFDNNLPGSASTKLPRSIQAG